MNRFVLNCMSNLREVSELVSLHTEDGIGLSVCACYSSAIRK